MGLIDRAMAGDRRALARVASILERGDDRSDAALVRLPPPPAGAQTIGITGPPGAGKSSIVDHLVKAFLERGDNVAVLLVDPSSPFTGGAVLGDRVRLAEWPDDRVFIRSIASRGWEGGLAPSTAFMIRLFAAAGFGRILVESVGVGQDAVDIRHLADTVMVVQVPNLGDTVQTLKAGILEIADVYVVNKADLPGSHTTVRELSALLRLVDGDSRRFPPQVIAVSALEGTGFDLVVQALDGHRAWLAAQSPSSPAAPHQTSWYLRKRLQSELGALADDPAFHAIAVGLSSGQVTAAMAARRVKDLLAER